MRAGRGDRALRGTAFVAQVWGVPCGPLSSLPGTPRLLTVAGGQGLPDHVQNCQEDLKARLLTG